MKVIIDKAQLHQHLKINNMRTANIFNYANAMLTAALTNLFVQIFWLSDRQVVIDFTGEPYSIHTSTLSYLILAIIILPVAIHGLLKKGDMVSKQVLRTHATSSILFIFVIICLSTSIPPIATNWEHAVFPVPVFQQWKLINASLTLIVSLFILTQCLFVAYVVIKTALYRNKMMNNITE